MGWTAVKFHVDRTRRCGLLLTLTIAVGAGMLAVTAAAAQVAAATAQMPPPVLSPKKIGMGTFYDGTRVHIEGTAPADSGVVVVIRGSEADEFFNRKGRVGLIWLNVDRIHIKNAPSVFLTFSSADVKSLVDQADVDRYQLDEASIMSGIRCFCHCKCSLTDRTQQSGIRDLAPDASYAKLLLADFLRFKERKGTYCMHTGAVKLASGNSATRYALDFEWPKKVPPGNYQVEVYACREHKVIAHSAATLQLMEIGFPAYMADLASRTPWVYGTVAVLVAIIAGFLTDFITTKLRRRKRRSETGNELHAPEIAETPAELTSVNAHDEETVHRR
jgi:Putative transmembrane protein (Alph_Pro_TM)